MKTEVLKPLLRGHLHQAAFFVSLGACSLLIALAKSPIALMCSIVFSLGLLTLFGVSALYHRPNWEPKGRAVMKRLDHSAIFLLIAGTFTPVCLLALPAGEGPTLLTVVWAAAIAGIFQSVFWTTAPKWFTAAFYIAVGWLIAPYWNELSYSLGDFNLTLLTLGGLAYTLGAVFYAAKRPKLMPEIFGYHELFHALTIVGAALHFAVVFSLIR